MSFRPQEGVGCLSAVVGLRCHGLSLSEVIGLYIPVALSAVFLPLLVQRAWHRPQAALLFLALEIVTSVAVSTWDLVFQLDRPGPRMYQVADIALGLTSSLPILFLFLTSTSIYLSLLRPALPYPMRAGRATVLFSVVVLPIVPVGFVATLLGGVLFLVYQTDRRALTVRVGYLTAEDEWTGTVITATGAIAITAYTLLTTTLTQFPLSHPASFARFIDSLEIDSGSTPTTFPTSFPNASPGPTAAARTHATRILILLTLGQLCTAVDAALTLVPTSFTLLLARQVLRLLSRGLLSVALFLVYRPRGRRAGDWGVLASGGEVHPHQAQGGTGKDERGVASAMKSRETRGGWFRVGKAKDGKSGKRRKEKEGKRQKFVISTPDLNTFQHLSTEGTRAFHATKNRQHNRLGDTPLNDLGTPVERVVFRTPAARAPVLSFTSSLFTSVSLNALAALRTGDTPTPTPTSSTPTPISLAVSPRETAAKTGPIKTGRRRADDGSKGRTTKMKMKKYVGSIYDPSRVSVQPGGLAPWPLPPPRAVTRSDRQDDTSTAREIGLGVDRVMRQTQPAQRFSVRSDVPLLGVPISPRRSNHNQHHNQHQHQNQYQHQHKRQQNEKDFGIGGGMTNRPPSRDIPSIWKSVDGPVSIRDIPRGLTRSATVARLSQLSRLSPGMRETVAGSSSSSPISPGASRQSSIRRKPVPVLGKAGSSPSDAGGGIAGVEHGGSGAKGEVDDVGDRPPRPDRRQYSTADATQAIHAERAKAAMRHIPQRSVDVVLGIARPISPSLRSSSLTSSPSPDEEVGMSRDGAQGARNSARLVRRETDPIMAINPEVTSSADPRRPRAGEAARADNATSSAHGLISGNSASFTPMDDAGPGSPERGLSTNAMGLHHSPIPIQGTCPAHTTLKSRSFGPNSPCTISSNTASSNPIPLASAGSRSRSISRESSNPPDSPTSYTSYYADETPHNLFFATPLQSPTSSILSTGSGMASASASGSSPRRSQYAVPARAVGRRSISSGIGKRVSPYMNTLREERERERARDSSAYADSPLDLEGFPVVPVRPGVDVIPGMTRRDSLSRIKVGREGNEGGRHEGGRHEGGRHEGGRSDGRRWENTRSEGRKSGEVRSMMASLYRITRDAGVDADPARLGIGPSPGSRLDVRRSGVSGVSGVSDVSGISGASGISRASEYSMASLGSSPLATPLPVSSVPVGDGAQTGGSTVESDVGSNGGREGMVVEDGVERPRRYRGGVI